MNAGVMLPTPIRARRNPKWPKEWETDWEICEASASAMLRIQSVPTKFPNAKVIEEMAGEEFEESFQGPECEFRYRRTAIQFGEVSRNG